MCLTLTNRNKICIYWVFLICQTQGKYLIVIGTFSVLEHPQEACIYMCVQEETGFQNVNCFLHIICLEGSVGQRFEDKSAWHQSLCSEETINMRIVSLCKGLQAPLAFLGWSLSSHSLPSRLHWFPPPACGWPAFLQGFLGWPGLPSLPLHTVHQTWV